MADAHKTNENVIVIIFVRLFRFRFSAIICKRKLIEWCDAFAVQLRRENSARKK